MNFVDRIRRGKGRKFPCPYCSKDVTATSTGHGSYKLEHKCQQLPKDLTKQHYNRDMLSAFVSYCKPNYVYPPVEGLEVEERGGKASIFK